MADIVFVTNEDDWQGVYVDGWLKDQGHNVSWLFVLETLIGEEIECVSSLTVDSNWLSGRGNLPYNFSDVVLK